MLTMARMHSRRDFLSFFSGISLLLLTPAAHRVHHACRPVLRRTTEHPEPRPGIDASRVLTGDQLSDHPGSISAFDQVREIPQIVDGIGCSCGCASREGFYSLLSCYEGEGMARMCEVCQGTGRLAFRLHKQGKSLAEIREAVDLRFR
jgi:hypothetical protein